MKIEIEESALESIKAQVQRLHFVEEYAEAWEDGMAGDSYLLRMANSLIDRYTTTPKVMELSQQDQAKLEEWQASK